MKVGGKRVSPKEIEEVITLLPEVIDCAVSGVDDSLLGEAIKAQVVINADKSTLVNPEFIREHCKKHLSLYKVPTYIEVETTLQITATGKKVKNVNS